MDQTNTPSDKIIDRIRKLIALGSNNPNEHEAEVAMRRAHKLLAEYNLTLADMTEKERAAADPYLRDTMYVPNFQGCAAARRIAQDIGRLYFCKMFYRNSPNGDVYSFVGRGTNVALAKDITAFVIKALRLQSAKGGSLPGYRTNFMNAAMYEIHVRCKKMIEEAEAGLAKNVEGTANLPALRNTYLAEQQGADDFIASNVGKLKEAKSSLKGGHGVYGSADGAAAGRSINLRPTLAKSSSKKQESLR